MDLIQRKGAETEKKKRGVGSRERVRGIDKMKRKERERGTKREGD